MWERGARHNPISLRYRFYSDHRPFLPQDPTLGFVRRPENSYESIYFAFRIAKDKLKYIYSNNIPVQDREDFKNLIHYDNIVRNNLKYIAAIASIFMSSGILKMCNFGSKHWMKFLTIFVSYKFIHMSSNQLYLNYYNDMVSYYYFKYQNIAVDEKSQVKDPRREFINLDKSVYYRETSQEIRHKSHHPANHGHHDHDTSTYYGPYPYDDHQNLGTVAEISRKFTEGTCAFDNPENELLLNEPIDINRVVRSLPTSEEYRNI